MGARHVTLPIAAIVGANVAALRRWRSLSLRDLETRTERAGHRITRDCLSEIERAANRLGAPRAITVDQLVVLARVLRVSTQQLLDPDCPPGELPARSASARGTHTSPEKRQNGA
jgi:hypothetical protein